MKNIGVRSLIVGLCLMGLGSWSPSLKAQIADRVYKTDYHIDPEKARELSVELDNISFFKDNEYTGKFTKGYSLPGLWVQGKAVYYPLRNIKLEAGVHMLIYHGANKYPSMAYQDIAYWKGDQYQKGVHVLPYFRAQMALSDHVNIVLGNIYGASNHNLIEPLYNPELNLTCDPEAGLQLLYDSKAFDLDVRANDFSLSNLVQNVFDVCRPMIIEKGHHLTMNISKVRHEGLYGDESRLQQVLVNILSNAVKYTPAGGVSAVSGHTDADRIEYNRNPLPVGSLTCANHGSDGADF